MSILESLLNLLFLIYLCISHTYLFFSLPCRNNGDSRKEEERCIRTKEHLENIVSLVSETASVVSFISCHIMSVREREFEYLFCLQSDDNFLGYLSQFDTSVIAT